MVPNFVKKINSSSLSHVLRWGRGQCRVWGMHSRMSTSKSKSGGVSVLKIILTVRVSRKQQVIRGLTVRLNTSIFHEYLLILKTQCAYELMPIDMAKVQNRVSPFTTLRPPSVPQNWSKYVISWKLRAFFSVSRIFLNKLCSKIYMFLMVPENLKHRRGDAWCRTSAIDMQTAFDHIPIKKKSWKMVKGSFSSFLHPRVLTIGCIKLHY